MKKYPQVSGVPFIRGLRVPELPPPNRGVLYIYIYVYIYIIVCIVCITLYRNYLKKYIVNQKFLTNKMCLEFNFTYAMRISLRSVNPLIVLYKYIYV